MVSLGVQPQEGSFRNWILKPSHFDYSGTGFMFSILIMDLLSTAWSNFLNDQRAPVSSTAISRTSVTAPPMRVIPHLTGPTSCRPGSVSLTAPLPQPESGGFLHSRSP